MKEFLRSQFAHYLVWASGLVVLLVIRPRPWSILFVSIVTVVMALGVSLMWRSHMDTAKAKRVFSLWETRIRTLSPTIDVEDDGHLYEWLDPPQLDAVFSELEKHRKSPVACAELCKSSPQRLLPNVAQQVLPADVFAFASLRKIRG